MISQSSQLYLLLAILVRVSVQQCTIEEFEANKCLDLLRTTELSEANQNFTIEEIIYNCLSTSRIIGIYRSMSVSVLYIRSDALHQPRDVRYDLLCKDNSWMRYGQHHHPFISNDTRMDCSSCVIAINESDHHCTPCSDSCTGLNQCYGPTTRECCNYNDRGICTDECGVNKEVNSTFHCVCSNYWIGDDCTNCGLVCLNGGTHNSDCTACHCIPGYKGTVCDVNINECDPDPCQNGGICTDLINDYNCTGCAVGYNGKNCSNNIDDCDPNPCLNGGSCIDRVNSYICECAAGFNGTNCESNIDECLDGPCQNGGSCRDGINSYTCTCMAGYTSTNCEKEINECSSNPCQNGGMCTDLINGYSCACKSTYTGPDCSGCAVLDCDECKENKDYVLGECTKCTGAYVLDQGTCNDNCGISNCIVCNRRGRKCIRCEEGYNLSSEGECNGETPDDDSHFIILIVMSAVVLLILIGILVTSLILYYECKKPKKRKPDDPANSYSQL